MVVKLKMFALLLAFVVAVKGQSPFELQELLSGAFSSSSWNGTWISDDTFVFHNQSSKDLWKFDVPGRIKELFVTSDVWKDYKSASVTVSPDENYLLIRYNPKAIFRHSTEAQFTVYNIATRKYFDLANKKHMKVAQWISPNKLLYVLENNIYYLSNPEVVNSPVQITTDGIPGIIYNGVPDWVYEEEVLASGSALWVSPNGEKLAFMSFNDTAVAEFPYFIYGTPGKLANQYPELVKLRYPKVGTLNPTVSLNYFNLRNPAGIVKLDIVPTSIVSNDHIIYGVTWVNNDEVVAITTNRISNIEAISRCNVASGSCALESTQSETNGWVGGLLPMYSDDGARCVRILPQSVGNDRFDHLVSCTSTNATTKRLTSGLKNVNSIFGWDQVNNLVYYSGTADGNPDQEHIYVVNTETLRDDCLTCNYTTPEGLCRYAKASFSTQLSYYAKICTGTGPAYVTVQNSRADSDSFVWLANEALRDKLKTKTLPVMKDLTVPLPNGFTARVRLLLPPGLNENNTTAKYPVVLNVYGGPGSTRISDGYSSGVENYFVTNRKYIYALLDVRGTSRRGYNMMFQIYKKLATVEVQDSISVMKYLQNNIPYIDANRTGVWGWSYGGFNTAWIMAQDTQNVFKFGLSVAPVTNFVLYDSIYTERYMGLPTPDDNEAGYNNTDVTRQAGAFKNKQYFLIHGNADDNVHYQQSMFLSKALEEADVQFFQQSYPDENHSLGGVSPHLYHTIDRYFARSCGLPDPTYPVVKKEPKKE